MKNIFEIIHRHVLMCFNVHGGMQRSEVCATSALFFKNQYDKTLKERCPTSAIFLNISSYRQQLTHLERRGMSALIFKNQYDNCSLSYIEEYDATLEEV